MIEGFEALLDRLTATSRALFGDDLIGVYLHGSAAMGCFNPKTSDLDLLLVTDTAPERAQKRAFLQTLLKLNSQAPPKGLELSVVRRQVCDPFQYPTPYEFHFSPSHLELALRDAERYLDVLVGTDRDLAAHFMIVRRFGIALWGPPAAEVFGPVPKEAYLDSLLYDVGNAEAEIWSDPVYLTLNLCRVLAFVREGAVLSKKEGGSWALQNLPEHFSDWVGAAVQAYVGDGKMVADPGVAQDFARYMLEEIRPKKF